MKTLEEIRAIRAKLKGTISMRFEGHDQTKVIVAMGEEGLENGARAVLSAIGNVIQEEDLFFINLQQNGHISSEGNGPIVLVEAPGKEAVRYEKVTPEQAVTIVKAIEPHKINKEA